MVDPAAKRRLLVEFLATEERRERLARAMWHPFQVRFEEALKLLPHDDETEEKTAFLIAKEFLDRMFNCFEDHEYVREREEIVRMCPWGSSDLIDVDALLATFSWYTGPMFIYKLPDGLVEMEKPTKVVKPTKTWVYSPDPEMEMKCAEWVAAERYGGVEHFIQMKDPEPDLGLQVTWSERKSSTPEPELQPEPERKMKIRVDAASD